MSLKYLLKWILAKLKKNVYCQSTHAQMCILHFISNWPHPGLSKGFTDFFLKIGEGQINAQIGR